MHLRDQRERHLHCSLKWFCVKNIPRARHTPSHHVMNPDTGLADGIAVRPTLSLMPIPLVERREIQGSDKPIASHHCLHSGMQVRHYAGSPYFLVAYEWQSACLKMT